MIALVLWSLAVGAEPLGRTNADAGAIADPDGGVPQVVEIHGLQISIAADASTPGHRPVEGAVEEVSLLAPRPARTAAFTYDDFLEARSADLSSCASWSPDGRQVKGWLSVEWSVALDGTPSRFKVLENDLDSPLVERCMLREMSSWRFPPPPSEGFLVRHSFYLSLPARKDLAPTGAGVPEP